MSEWVAACLCVSVSLCMLSTIQHPSIWLKLKGEGSKQWFNGPCWPHCWCVWVCGAAGGGRGCVCGCVGGG